MYMYTVRAANYKDIIWSTRPDRKSSGAGAGIHPRAGSAECSLLTLRYHQYAPPARAPANRHDNHTPRGVRASVADASLACSFSSHSRSAASERCSSTALACAITVRMLRRFPMLPPPLPPSPRELDSGLNSLLSSRTERRGCLPSSSPATAAT